MKDQLRSFSHRLKYENLKFIFFQHGIEGGKSDIDHRIAVFGSNARKPPTIKTVWELIKECFEDDMLQLLLLAALVSLIVGVINDGFKNGWIEGTSIFLAVAIITVVTTTNNYAKQKQFLKLYLCLNGNQTVNVIRNGNKIEIPSSDIVVGDLILIQQGMELPADAILIKGQGVSCNEGSITGESKIMEKKAITEGNNHHEVDSILTGSTFVNEGSGVAMVICVGENS